jgi:hypothetical protein
MMLRIFIDIILILSIFYFPWWVTALFALSGIFIFKNFYESIIAGFLIDALYGTKTSEFAGVWFVFTASFFLLYILSTRLKKNIRIYETA